MHLIITIVTIVCSAILTLLILLQQRSAGVGQAFGGSSAVYRSRRGIERVLFNLTIVLTVIYIALALANILVP